MANKQIQTTVPTITIRATMPRHGGAWKVAYADFVTAMMAFFLLMWLLNMTTEEQKNAISNYFDPTVPLVSRSESGAGGVMGGLTASEGSMSSTTQAMIPPREEKTIAKKVFEKGKSKKSAKVEDIKEALRKIEEEEFKKAMDQLKKAMEDNPKLKDLSENLKIDITQEGLRIQVIDQDGKPMFASGSAQMFDKTKQLMAQIAEVIHSMDNELSIRGHTDSVGYGSGASYTNWELSSDRANSTRRALKNDGVQAERLNNVMGKAATDPYLPDNPENAQNRRISIILLRKELTNPDFAKEEIMKAEQRGEFDFEDENESEDGTEGDYAPGYDNSRNPVGTFRRSPGNIDFP